MPDPVRITVPGDLVDEIYRAHEEHDQTLSATVVERIRELVVESRGASTGEVPVVRRYDDHDDHNFDDDPAAATYDDDHYDVTTPRITSEHIRINGYCIPSCPGIGQHKW